MATSDGLPLVVSTEINGAIWSPVSPDAESGESLTGYEGMLTGVKRC